MYLQQNSRTKRSGRYLQITRGSRALMAIDKLGSFWSLREQRVATAKDQHNQILVVFVGQLGGPSQVWSVESPCGKLGNENSRDVERCGILLGRMLIHWWITGFRATRVSEKLIETWNPHCVVSGSLEDDSPHLDTVTSPKSGLHVAMKTVFQVFSISWLRQPSRI